MSLSITTNEKVSRLPRKAVKKGQVGRAFAKHERGNAPETDTRVMTNYVTQTGVTGTVIGLAFSSSGVSSATEFASMAARYQEYRVLAIRVKWRPHYSQQSDPDSGLPMSAVFTAATAPTTVLAFAASDGFEVSKAFCKAMDRTIEWSMNPNARLWCDRGSSIPPANAFGVAFRHPGLCTAALNGFVVVDAYLEYDVEWRTAL